MQLSKLSKCPYCAGDTFTRRTAVYTTDTYTEHFFFDSERTARIMPQSHERTAHTETVYFCASCLKTLCREDEDLTREAEQRYIERRTRKRPVIVSAAETSIRLELKAAHMKTD